MREDRLGVRVPHGRDGGRDHGDRQAGRAGGLDRLRQVGGRPARGGRGPRPRTVEVEAVEAGLGHRLREGPEIEVLEVLREDGDGRLCRARSGRGAGRGRARRDGEGAAGRGSRGEEVAAGRHHSPPSPASRACGTRSGAAVGFRRIGELLFLGVPDRAGSSWRARCSPSGQRTSTDGPLRARTSPSRATSRSPGSSGRMLVVRILAVRESLLLLLDDGLPPPGMARALPARHGSRGHRHRGPLSAAQLDLALQEESGSAARLVNAEDEPARRRGKSRR